MTHPGIAKDLALAIDVGTGSVRAALVDAAGAILSVAAVEQHQVVPAFGWSEQSVTGWWTGVVEAIREVLDRVPGGGTACWRSVPAGRCTAPFWSTATASRRGPMPRSGTTSGRRRWSAAFEAEHAASDYLMETANPATPAWPGFKLAWLRDHDPEAYARASHVLMPKDFINLRLTGEVAMDPGDASCSFLMDPRTGAWSTRMAEALGLDTSKLPPIRDGLDILGAVTSEAALATGLLRGTPVLVGGADYPMALFGSGACRPGLASDVTGTSCILTLIAEEPLLDPEICNVKTIEGHWGPFVLLETGGDAMRWARRALHGNAVSYDATWWPRPPRPGPVPTVFSSCPISRESGSAAIATRGPSISASAPRMACPNCSGPRWKGSGFAAARHLRIMEAASGRPVERVIASGGGAKTALWLRIKASIYGVPIVVPEEPECGLVGCAALALTAGGRFGGPDDAVRAMVRFTAEIAPDAAWSDTYGRMQPVFDRLYAHSQALYDDLDALGPPSDPWTSPG